VTGDYDFFICNDDEAQLFVSTDTTLNSFSWSSRRQESPAASAKREGQSTSRNSSRTPRGARAWKQHRRLRCWRRDESAIHAAQKPSCRSNLIDTVLNPDTAIVSYSAQPQSVSVVAGNRAYSLPPRSPGGPVFYQWQVNGADGIPGPRAQA
jgi:hypothetical protein